MRVRQIALLSNSRVETATATMKMLIVMTWSQCETRFTHRNSVGILLADALGLSLPLLERVLVLELGSHVGGICRRRGRRIDVFSYGDSTVSAMCNVWSWVRGKQRMQKGKRRKVLGQRRRCLR
jgi:hypothetical protein